MASGTIKAYLNSQQTSLDNGEWAVVNLDAVLIPSGGDNRFSTGSHRFTSDSNGYYWINAQVRFSNNIEANRKYAVGIFRGKDTEPPVETVEVLWHAAVSVDDVECVAAVSDIIEINENYWIELRVFPMGLNKECGLGVGERYTFLTITKL